MLHFVMRWQQFTGPVMAKGLEDTASYRYHALLSINEVGGDPLRVKPPMDLAGFHEFNRERARRWRGGLSATSTHDTKRGEDARARLNVLSELPREWEERFDCWSRTNDPLKKQVGGRTVPGANEEFLIYQTLLGTWPAEETELAGYPDRLCLFLEKASREAKLQSNWIRPDVEYEKALQDFTVSLLDPGGKFLEQFLPFQKKVAFYGALNGLGQSLLKAAAPGVPDYYQGSELWNFSLVDPDNRRPVDYRKRRDLLDRLKVRESEDRAALAAELAREPWSDAAKLWLIWKALGFRGSRAALFAEGEYLPLEASGAHAECVLALARRHGDEWAVAVAARWWSRLGCTPPAFNSCDWKDTAIILPEGAPTAWRNALTGAAVERFAMAEVLRDFPVALLEGG
jgi:(1->4)-alpha-D-glucan 1-alpha-D-glucosylmutase